MADEFFEGLWNEVVKEIKEVYSSDRKFLRTKVYPEREKAYNTLQTNYIRYVGIINKLGECYSQIIQPQEREIIKKMLDCCIGRLIEIKHELVEVEKTDFIYMDNILIQMKKTIMDLEIVVPEYYRTDRIEQLEHIDSVIAQALQAKAAAEARQLELEQAPPEEEEGLKEGGEGEAVPEGQETAEGDRAVTPVFDDSSKFARRSRSMSRRATDTQVSKRPKFKVVELTEEEKAVRAAIFLIQRHERARVARLTVQIAREKIRLMEDIAWLRHKPIPEDVKLKVSKVIQRYWTRYKKRRHQTFRSVQRNLIMGLLEPSWTAGNEIRMTVEELGANRRIAQREAMEAMEDASIVARLRMEKNSDRICDSIADELRYFIFTWYKAMEAANLPMLPEWPDPTPIIPGPFVHGVPKDAPEGLAEKMIKSVVNTLSGREPEPIGGSALITAGHWIPVDVYAFLMEQIEKSKNAPKAEKKKLSKKELKEKLKKEKELEAKRLADLKKEGFVPTPSKFTVYLDTSLKDFSVDWEKRDVTRKHNQNLIDANIAMVLHFELRNKVDEDMKLELERLQNAINADRGLPPVVKKEPKQKKKGRKKKKDPTGNMTEDELIADLAVHGLIAPYKRWYFIDLPGALSLANYEGRTIFFEDPPPQWGDFKQIVKEYCVLHLGSNFTHQRTPLVRSVLICGPIQIIQEYADVICTESGAVKFLLDPLAMPLNAYKKKMFDHMFTKVPRLFKPAIIFIPGAEKIFYKTVPKEEKEFNPKALGKIIPKMVKAIKPGDQILILGITDQPWVATANQMTKTFDKVLCFPDCDYQSLNRFWSERLFKFHNINRYFNVPAVTNMTRGYGLNELEEKLNNLMTAERILSLKNKPLLESELCLDLPSLDVKKPQMNSWEWSQKSLKMYIQRRNQLQIEAEKRAKMKKSEKKPQDKKKQKKKEIKDKQVIDNDLLSRASDRPVTSCGPWAPQREKDALQEYYNLKGNLEVPTKTNLYRNEKSLEQFPINKPNI